MVVLNPQPCNLHVITLFMPNPDLTPAFIYTLKSSTSLKTRLRTGSASFYSTVSSLSVHRDFRYKPLFCPKISYIDTNYVIKGHNTNYFCIFTLLTLVLDNIWFEVHHKTVSSGAVLPCVLLSKRANPMSFPGVHPTVSWE